MEAGPIGTVWQRLERLIDRASYDDLRSHRLETFAVARFRASGREVPEDFAAAERLAAIAAITAPEILAQVAAASPDDLVLFKGPLIASLYPNNVVRGYGDIDVLARSAGRVQLALLGAAFEAVGDPDLYVDIHHLRPLRPRGLLLPVEVHSRVKWIEPLRGPSADELFAAAVPGELDHILTMAPEHHLLVLAVHSWAHEPLRRLRDILDVALALSIADEGRVDELAREWGVERLWQTTRRAVAALAGAGDPPAAMRTWARNLSNGRERTVLENHLQRWFSDFSALPAAIALRRLPANLARELWPSGGDTWRSKLRRVALAVRNARTPRSSHEGELRDRGDLGR